MMVQIHNITETNIELPLNKKLINNIKTSINFNTPFNNINISKQNNNYLNLSILWFPVLLILIFSSFFLINNSNSYVLYYYSSWFELYATFGGSDIETLANMIYLAYPTALVFLGILLWSVLIGVIKITMAANNN